MKKNFNIILCLSALLLFLFSNVKAQDTPATKKQIHDVATSVDAISKRITTLETANTKTETTNTNPDCINCNSTCLKQDLKFIQWLLVFSPAILFFLVLYVVYRRLRNENVTLASILSEKNADPVNTTVNIQDPNGTQTNTQTSTLPQSTSRFVLFLSGLAAVIISVCIVTYWMYFYLHTGCPPKLDGLTNGILALGIGVVPYAIRKITDK